MNLRLFLFMGILGAAGLQVLSAQGVPAHRSSLDFALTYNPQVASINTSNSFFMQGGSAQLHGQFWRGLGVAADVAETHTADMHNSGVGLDLVTATFGPRYTWRLPSRNAHTSKISVYGQFLAGEVWGLHSAFPATGGVMSNDNNLALLTGGGANLRLTRRLSWRVVEANWLYTHLPNATGQSENSLRLGTGFVIRLQ